MESPPLGGTPRAESGSTQSPDDRGPLAPSGSGPESMLDPHDANLSPSLCPTPEEPTAEPACCDEGHTMTHAQEGRTPVHLRTRRDSTQKKLFFTLATSGLHRRAHSGDSDGESDSDETLPGALLAPRSWGAKAALNSRRAPGGPSSIVKPQLAQMSLRRQEAPAPPVRHVPNIADVGASLVAETTVRMKRRLGEHTLHNLAARMSDSFFHHCFYSWHQSASNGRTFLIRAQRQLERQQMRLKRRALQSWQHCCMWSRIIENLARGAILRNEGQCKNLAWNKLLSYQRRTRCIEVMVRRADLRCLRTGTRKWSMSSRVSRVRANQTARVSQRKNSWLTRASFEAIAAVVRAEKSLYCLDRLVHKTSIVTAAINLRAWREHIDFNAHMEKAGGLLERRWELLHRRLIFREWFEVVAFNRTASHAAFAVTHKVRRTMQMKYFIRWTDAKHEAKILDVIFVRIASRGRHTLALKIFERWIQEHADRLRLKWCHAHIKAKYELHEEKARAFDGWKTVLDQARGRRAANRRALWHDWQISGLALMSWRNASRCRRKTTLCYEAMRRRLGRRSLLKHFTYWQHSSLRYFQSWRRSRKLKSRFDLALVGLSFATWREKIRGKSRISWFNAKINTKVLYCYIQEWSFVSQQSISRSALADQGTDRMASLRAYRMQIECMDIWHAKFRSRNRVKEMIQTNLQKARHSIKGRCFAEMARRVENGVFRRTQVRKHLRLRRVRIVIKVFDSFARHRENRRAYAHRSYHIRRTLVTNVFYNMFERWMDALAVSQTKAKLFYSLVARGHFKDIAKSFNTWCSGHQQRKRTEQKLTKRLWLTVPRYQVSWVLSTWVDKHNRTMHFERLVWSKNARCCQQALDCWYDSFKDAALQASGLIKLTQRVFSKHALVFFESWRVNMQSKFVRELSVRRAQIAMARKQQDKVLSIWHQHTVMTAHQKARASFLSVRWTTTATCNVFSAWNDYRLDCRSYQRELSRTICRMSRSSQKAHFHSWRAVSDALRYRNLRLEKVCKRMLTLAIRIGLGEWYEIARAKIILLRKCLQVNRSTRRHLAAQACHRLQRHAVRWKKARELVDRRWNTSVLACSHQVCWPAFGIRKRSDVYG